MVKPSYLNSGDKIAVVAPSGRVVIEKTTFGIDTLKSWGFETLLSTHLFDNDFRFAGTDHQRTSDLQHALDNPDIKAIFCARGGYGLTRIIDSLDFTSFLKNPKWIIGFSDITALLCHVYQLDVQTIHGPMPNSFKATEQEYLAELLNILTGKGKSELSYPSDIPNRPGKAKGKLIGGNLTLLSHIIGTKSSPDYKNSILFLEDLNEELYHTERMLVQLKRSGILDTVNGILVGQFTDMEDSKSDPFGKNVTEMLLDLTNASTPVSTGLPVGHGAKNHPLIVGATITLDVEVEKTQINYLEPLQV